MIEIGSHRIYAGDFHTHWYWDKENPTIYLAGMDYLGLDFVVLQDGLKRANECDRLARSINSNFRFFPGKEMGYPFAHIVTWLDGDEKESEPSALRPDIVPKEIFRSIKEKTKLTIFGHPTKNFSAAYDDSFNPLIELYQEGLIDGIQISNTAASLCYASYLAFLDKGIEVPVVAGFDVHACHRLPEKSPDYLFNDRIHPFDVICPCYPAATLVFADELSEEAIIEAVRKGKSVVYDFEDDSFIGPSSLIKILEEGNYARKRRNRINKRNKIQIECGDIIVGEKAFLSVNNVKWDNTSRIYYPDTSLYHSRESKAKEVIIDKFPSLLKRSQFYFPLNVKMKDEGFVFAVLAQEPIVMNLNSRVERIDERWHYYIECLLENRTRLSKEVQMELEGELSIDNPNIALFLEGSGKGQHLFEASGTNLTGFEYELKSKGICGDFSLVNSARISFPVCCYLEKGESPWDINEKGAIIIGEPFQVHEYTRDRWKGPQDCSGKINLYWDEKDFYLYAVVQDDVFYQNWTGWETFWGDSIQFVFEPSIHRKTRGYGTNYEFILAKTRQGNEVMVWNTPQAGDKHVIELSKTAFLDVTRHETSKVTEYRCTMPWSSLKPFVPKEGAQFKAAFVINDNDGPVIPQRCMLFYGGNTAVCKDTSLAHNVTLVKSLY